MPSEDIPPRGDNSTGDEAVTTTLSKAELHAVVRDAVEDAILGAIGTVLLVGIGLLLVAAGGQAILGGTSSIEYAVGGGLLLFGVYLAATATRVIPTVWDWMR